MTKRRFGRVRQLPSGRWQARYPGPDGVDRPAPDTFETKTDADIWLTLKEAEIRQGDWIDPDAGKVRFGDYADAWVNDHVLKPRTEELYRGLLKNHLKPAFAITCLADLRSSVSVRAASSSALSGGSDGQVTLRPCRDLIAETIVRLASASPSPERIAARTSSSIPSAPSTPDLSARRAAQYNPALRLPVSRRSTNPASRSSVVSSPDMR